MVSRLKKPLWILPLALALLVAGLGWWGDKRLRANIEDGLSAQLKTTLNANVTALGIWVTNQTRLALALSEDTEVRALASEILNNHRASLRESSRPSDLEKFAALMRPRLTSLGYGAAQIVDTNFAIVANITARGPVGGRLMLSDAHTNKFADVFTLGESVLITPFKPEMLVSQRAGRRPGNFQRAGTTAAVNRLPPNLGQPRRGDISLMQVAAPVRNPAGPVRGALALIINPDKEFTRILSVARSGDSGETYAFDQTGLMISQSRFDSQLKELRLLGDTNVSSALNLRLFDPERDLTKNRSRDGETNSLTQLVAGALTGADEVLLEPVRDYRGVLVVGASRWLPQFGFGVATQLDAAEAFRPLYVLEALFGIQVLLLLFCATAMFVISNLTWRRRLSESELKWKQLGQYTLEEKIGEGGMGVVYRARHALLRRATAVKLLLPDRADPAAITRFEREVCLSCQLSHPNTIQVYDYGHTPDGIFYYAMEFLSGLNLHDLVVRYGPQPEGRVVHILVQICDSLAEAHTLGLIHRDIKPGNVFLCRRGGVADCVKVLDFGLVREFRTTGGNKMPTEGNRLIEGTPWFMPPEAIEDSAPVGPRSDLYSLGALGYYLVTGRYIFDAETLAEVYEMQLNAAPIPPSHRTSQPVSAELENLILGCLEKDMNARPASALELRAQLQILQAASEWPATARSAWWDAYEKQTAAEGSAPTSTTSTPLPTVRIDLAERMN